MGTTTEPTSALAAAVAAAAPAAPAAAAAPARPDEQNVLIWPLFGSDPLDLGRMTVADGVLAYAQGGPIGEDHGGARVCAILSLGATLRGVGELVAEIVDSAIGGTSTASLAPDTVTRAICAYNDAYLDPDHTDKIKVGLRLTLPIEIDDVTGEWTVDRSALTEWAAAISTVDQTILDAPATSLPIPAPEDTRGSVEADIAAAAGADALAEIWAPQIVENPFAVVFDVVELFRQLRGDIYGNLPRAGDEVEFAVGLVARMRDFHLEQLAFASAGNAILRRLWRALDDGDTSTVANADLSTARERVARALGLAPDPNASGSWLPPTRWHPPRTAADVLDAVGPSVTPHELPLTDSQAVAKRSNEKVPGEPTGGRRGMVLGRDMYVCPFKLVSFKNKAGKITYVYSGPAFRGLVDPVAFATRHAAEIGLPGGTDLSQRCVRVATQIAGNEGFLDACRSADRGLISTGMQQWSMHNNNEMTVLLHRFQDRAWDHYDLFFGMWGILPRMCGASEEARPPDDAAVLAANPDATAATFAGPNFPHNVTVDRLSPGGRPTPMVMPTSAADTGNARVVFFGGTAAGHSVTFNHTWCARIRLAGRQSIEYGVVQVQTAAYRFKRILDGPGAPPLRAKAITVDGVAHHVPDLFSSKFGAGSVLDQHINAPGNIEDDIGSAVTRALPPRVPPIAPHLPAGGLDPRWLQRYAVDYLAGRRFNDLDTKADRDDRLVTLHDNGLSPDPATFPAWP